ncbi:MFS transporter [Lactonifactor longoviformis]|uniref:Glycoside/pentoside/hexuronide:cation symporter, GPH family n=1 Tax=Lactonifactor longoviformis DSM 17459 TaxID=1122155 RepID=A0A1M4US28_9CLOT|nr:glycoside-pentoside-hexuronide (GPH):cation symporter [Lactonifactor longoviformis]POP32118.1 MFS transporter [Lactonifactor longoviformis]SHE59504.1 glycoside/pentoside/hexuronide:cation symporter, GPH family [Lactonifactor longoviformis DSM 17459]
MDDASKNRRSREDHVVSFREKICYGLGDSACNVVYGLCSTLLTFFYTDYVGINAFVVGIIFLITRLFDGVSDIIMGFITDRTKSKYGKARPWILWMSVPYAVTFILLFLVPANASQTIQAIYIFVTYNLVNTIVYTALNLPYSTMASLITRDQKSRASTQAWRIFCGPMGKMVVTVSTLPLVKALGDTQRSWIIVSCIFAVIALVLLLVCFFNIEERVVIEAAQNQKVSVGKNLKALFSNQYWAICLGLWGIMVMMSTVSGTITTYYCKYILGNQDLYSPIYAAELIAQSIVVLIVPYFVMRFGKRNLTLAGILLVIVAQLVWITNPMSVGVAMTSAILRGIGVAPLWACVFPMIADCAEFGQWKTHVRQDGMIFSAASVGSKVGGGLASAGIGLLMDSVGYDGLAAAQSAEALGMIKAICMYAPIIFSAIIVVLCLLYKLDKLYPQVIADLRKRDEQGIL